MSRVTRRLLGVIALCMVAVVAFLGLRPGFRMSLNATQITPTVEDDGFSHVAPSEHVEVSVDVKNVGNAKVSGLRVETGCQCRVPKPLPDSLMPDQTARLVVRLPSPAVGSSRFKLPVFIDGQADPILVMSIAFITPVKPNTWLDRPRFVALKSVNGQNSKNEFLLEAVERKSDPSWIENVRTSTPESHTIRLTHERRNWGEDGQYCLRRYKISFTPTNDAAQSLSGQIIFQTRTDTPSTEPLPFSIETIPSISVVPSEVVLGAGSDLAKEVVVISRRGFDGHQTVIETKFDSDVIKVVPESDSTKMARTFLVQLAGSAKTSLDTSVEFSDGIDTATLRVKSKKDP